MRSSTDGTRLWRLMSASTTTPPLGHLHTWTPLWGASGEASLCCCCMLPVAQLLSSLQFPYILRCPTGCTALCHYDRNACHDNHQSFAAILLLLVRSLSALLGLSWSTKNSRW